jgi:hypothetical protein
MDATKAAQNQALFREVNEWIRNLEYPHPLLTWLGRLLGPGFRSHRA